MFLISSRQLTPTEIFLGIRILPKQLITQRVSNIQLIFTHFDLFLFYSHSFTEPCNIYSQSSIQQAYHSNQTVRPCIYSQFAHTPILIYSAHVFTDIFTSCMLIYSAHVFSNHPPSFSSIIISHSYNHPSHS